MITASSTDVAMHEADAVTMRACFMHRFIATAQQAPLPQPYHFNAWESRPQVLNAMTQSHSPRATLVLQGTCLELNLYSLDTWGE